MPIDPVTASILFSAGTTVLGKILGGKPKIPDLLTPAVNEAQNALRTVEEQQVRAEGRLEAEAAAQGVGSFSGGTAAREALSRASGSAFADIRASAMDTVANARQQQELIETQIKNQERERTLQGFANLGSAGSTALALKSLQPGQEASQQKEQIPAQTEQMLFESMLRPDTSVVELPRAQMNLNLAPERPYDPNRVFNPMIPLLNNVPTLGPQEIAPNLGAPQLRTPFGSNDKQRRDLFMQLQSLSIGIP